MRSSADIRTTFLDFFRSKGHVIVPSAPIVIKNDPTLMFTNAGMNQFKDYFLGNKAATHPRVADTQKCLRVSGKHNDLEEVGVDTYHHTMFEMLGNWSFGDYFKKEAIEWSWELLTNVFQIPIDRLYVTIFEGDEKEGLPHDEEAYTEWKKWIAEDRILLGNKKDNFWEMGDTGPCGPCTEIHVDTRSDADRKNIAGNTLVNRDNPQVIEVWNVVFIQYNRLKDGSLQPLPQRHVDTGMGFERLVRVLQNKQSNYDTDVFQNTIKKIAEITGKRYDASDSKEAVAFRVLADHIRAISFTISDGQLPSNTGAGYVIRRILRRAVRYYYSYLNYQQPLLFQLVPVIATQFENVFPELKEQEDFIKKLIKREEELFLKTLEFGLRRINTYVDINMSDNSVVTHGDEDTMVHFDIKEKYRKARHKRIIDGNFAFQLYDTFGFPIDLTRLIASEHGFRLDESGYEEALERQKLMSRAAAALETGDWAVLKEGSTEFLGYKSDEVETSIIKYRKVQSKDKDLYHIVLSKTPFYAESGGQVGDTGKLIFKEINKSVEIIDTKKENDLIIHIAKEIPTDLTGIVVAKIISDRRKAIAVHHSATHLLHAALHQILGSHAVQKGSLVSNEYLRFDFAHFTKVSEEELNDIEKIVNQKIRENIEVEIKYMSKEEASEMGAMALFGEKYSNEVRVVIMDFDFSKELCGGTHVGNTGELGFFKITSEGAVAAGVRRIEAVSGAVAENYVHEEFKKLDAVKAVLKNPKDIIKTIESLQEEAKNLIKTKDQLNRFRSHATLDRLILKKTSINNYNFYHDIILDADADLLKTISSEFSIKDQEKSVLLLIGKKNDKVYVSLALSDDLKNSSLDAAATIKQKIAPLIKGGGGGQKTLATAGGQNGTELQAVIDTVRGLL